MTSVLRLTMVLLTGVAGAVLTGALEAQTYPDKPVRLVVGFSAGGPTDLPARFIAERLGSTLGQRVIVDNRPGAAGQIATQDVLSRGRTGHTLLLCTHFESINAAVYKKVGYKLSDIAPITQISRYYYGIAMTPGLSAKDWEGFISYARANPGTLNYGTIGRGSAQEVLALELGKLTGIQMVGIPYKGGAEILPDLMGGRLHLYVSPTLSILPHYGTGRLRILAVTSAERLAAAPDVPTLLEKRLKFVRFGWLGICAGTGTPQPVIALLNSHITAIVKSADYRQMIEKAGSMPVFSTPAELRKILNETHEQTATIAREFGLQID